MFEEVPHHKCSPSMQWTAGIPMWYMQKNFHVITYKKKLYRNSVVNFNSRTCKELCFLIGLQLICQQSEIKTT